MGNIITYKSSFARSFLYFYIHNLVLFSPTINSLKRRKVNIYVYIKCPKKGYILPKNFKKNLVCVSFIILSLLNMRIQDKLVLKLPELVS